MNFKCLESAQLFSYSYSVKRYSFAKCREAMEYDGRTKQKCFEPKAFAAIVALFQIAYRLAYRHRLATPTMAECRFWKMRQFVRSLIYLWAPITLSAVSVVAGLA